MKYKFVLILIGLFIALSCPGQEQALFTFSLDIPHYTQNGIIWKKETIRYYNFHPEFDLYKSLSREFPYMYKFVDKNKEDHYVFVRENEIYIGKDRIEITKCDDSDYKVSVFLKKNNVSFSFELNK